MLDSYTKAILDNSPECIVLIGRNHEVLAYNKTICEVLKQYHGREIKVDDLYYPDFVIEANKKLYLDTFNEAIQGKSVTVQDLTQNENVSIWFEYRMTPVYDDSETLLGVTLSAKDITIRKEYEIGLKESEDRFRKISNLAPIGILITDEKLEITYDNRSARTIFEYEVGELTTLSLPDLINNLSFDKISGITVDPIGFEIETPLFYQERFEGRCKNGGTVNVVLSSSSFHSHDKLYYIFIIQDISDSVVKENLISQQNTKLRDIAWYQAHIIRAPLANIMGIVSMFEDKDLEISGLERDMMQQALIKSAHDLDKVICDIINKTQP